LGLLAQGARGTWAWRQARDRANRSAEGSVASSSDSFEKPSYD